MSVEQWWNDTDRGKLKCWEKNIIQCGWYMDEWVWSNGGMILTGENWSAGRKTLYSVGGRWMSKHSNGGMILTGENWSTGEKHYTPWVVDEWMSKQSNGGMVLTGESWSVGRGTSPSAILSTTRHMDWSGIATRSPQWEAGDWPPNPWHGIKY